MAETTFNSKLLAAMKAMSNPKKDTNAYKYKYAQLDQVLGIVRPALQEQGLEIRWEQEITLSEHGACVAIQKLYVFDANEEHLVDARIVNDKAPIQERGSEETYLRRYALQSVFALAAEDDDGKQVQKTAESAKNAARAPKKPKAEPTAEELAKRVEGGIKALEGLGYMDRENIIHELDRIDSQQARIDWLTKCYKTAKKEGY